MSRGLTCVGPPHPYQDQGESSGSMMSACAPPPAQLRAASSTVGNLQLLQDETACFNQLAKSSGWTQGVVSVARFTLPVVVACSDGAYHNWVSWTLLVKAGMVKDIKWSISVRAAQVEAALRASGRPLPGEGPRKVVRGGAIKFTLLHPLMAIALLLRGSDQATMQAMVGGGDLLLLLKEPVRLLLVSED